MQVRLEIIWTNKKACSLWRKSGKRGCTLFLVIKNEKKVKPMETKSNQFLGETEIGILMRKYAVPCIISLLVGALYNIVDQIFIANASYLGSYGNAANTVVFPLTVVALAIAVMIGDGCCAFVSISLGKKETKTAKQSVGNAVVMLLVSSIVLTAIYLIFSDQIIAMFGGTVNEETYLHSKEYFFYISLGIITISREFGSGGRTIGKKVAEKLEIPCYDSELIHKIAVESGFAEKYIEDAGKYAPGGFLSPAFSNRAFGPTNEDYLWQIQYKIITELAEKSPCVIVGRCADYILRDKADCLKVFIHASMDFRAKRIVEVYGEQEKTPMQRLKEKDKRRAAYHRFYTDMKWGHAQNYHITLDSGELGIDKCVEILQSLY